MKRFIRIGVVTAWPEDDWHSERLLASCARRAETVAIDPAALGTRVERDAVVVLAGGAPAAGYDAFILARGLGREGDPDVQFEIYRALEGTGALVVNRLDPLLAAQDKFRTSWMLRLAGVPTRGRRSRSRPTTRRGRSPRSARWSRSRSRVARRRHRAAPARRRRARAGAGAGRRATARSTSRRTRRTPGAISASSWWGAGRAPRSSATLRRGSGAPTSSGAGARRPRRSGPALAATAEAAAGALRLDYAGVDLVAVGEGATVLEVNGNPSWRGILEATGLDMAEVIAEHVLGRALRRHRSNDHIVLERSTGAIHG